MTETKIRELYGISKAEFLKRLDTKRLEEAKTPEALREEVERLADEQAKLANRRLSQEDIRAYVEHGDYLNRRYVSYLDRAIRALGTGTRYERLPTELAQYRPTLAEIYREYRAVELPRRYAPARYEPYRPAITEIREVPYRPPEERIPPERVPPERVPPYRPPPYKPPPPKPPPPTLAEVRGGMKRSYEGAVAWQQGALKREGKLVPVWKVWSRPYRQEELETFFEDELPPGVQTVKGIKSAYETIQQFRGEIAPRETQQADIGAFVATVHQPTAEPGGKDKIRFTRDIRGSSTEGLKKLPLSTTIEQLIEICIRKPEAEVSKFSVETLGTLGMEEVAEAKPSAKVRFARARLAEKIEDTTPAVLAGIINRMALTSSETKEVLRMLPDRERQQMRMILSEPGVYAPTRGEPKAEYLPIYLRRKKSIRKKTETAPMLAGVRL